MISGKRNKLSFLDICCILLEHNNTIKQHGSKKCDKVMIANK